MRRSVKGMRLKAWYTVGLKIDVQCDQQKRMVTPVPVSVNVLGIPYPCRTLFTNCLTSDIHYCDFLVNLAVISQSSYIVLAILYLLCITEKILYLICDINIILYVSDTVL